MNFLLQSLWPGLVLLLLRLLFLFRQLLLLLFFLVFLATLVSHARSFQPLCRPLLMFGTVARMNFGTAHLMWFYVLIFALLVGANFADRYSLDRMGRSSRPLR